MSLLPTRQLSLYAKEHTLRLDFYKYNILRQEDIGKDAGELFLDHLHNFLCLAYVEEVWLNSNAKFFFKNINPLLVAC